MSRAALHLLRYILGAIIALAIGATGIALDAASLDDVQATADSLHDAQRQAQAVAYASKKGAKP